MDSFEKRCRLCAKQQEASIMIFGAETASLELQSKLNKYLLLEVDEDDILPKIICTQCCKQLQEVCEFIDRTREAQETLLQSSTLYEHLKNIEKIKKLQMPQITNITFQGTKKQISTTVTTDVTPEFAEITYLHGADGENVTLTRNKGKAATSDPKEASEKPFACNLCRRKFLTEFALKNHAWLHASPGTDQTYFCTICDKIFYVKNDFLAHFKEHKHARYCPTCKRTFRTDRNLKLHMEMHSSNKSLFTCNYCGRSYSTKNSLKNHMISHSNEKPFQCTECKKRFKRRQELRFHCNKHTGERPFKCPKCDKRFTSSGNCYSHKIRMHPMQEPEEREVVQIGKSNVDEDINYNSKYKCRICSHTFNQKENFTYHMYQHTGIKPYHCIYCIEKFVTRRGIHLHYEHKHPGRDRPLALLTKTDNSSLN
ncbi:unnamed protein product [Pieris macdunnoughi]|uniref:Uncharacterized protein n=1 Tax=Pieris macdunnoughi TaxID=345717 RepID=A0A821NTI2_9NEOP|nr:unnamed protein product [Pieris macdunnoughi]